MVVEEEGDVSAEGEEAARLHGWRSEREAGKKVGCSFKRLFDQSIWFFVLLFLVSLLFS